ncbi:putative PurR-regulated permease PerM [Maribacter caenipelagi]|uniref:Putative PurR-regulated permease PerM n=1 Tax=Maribacter caenipelagi TaxID=1447781 RepID=A0A4R7D8Z8_9FLAO|nr:putative PurR-regulated permease PerM [Maribacter caenipelagi]
MLKPIVTYFERKFNNRILAIFTSYVLAVAPLFFLIFFFFNQTRILFSKLPSVQDRLAEMIIVFSESFDQKFNLEADTTASWISENVLAVSDFSIEIIRGSLQSTTTVLAHLVLIVVITYFMLLYSTAFKNFLLAQSNNENRNRLDQLFKNVQYLAKRYMLGQGLIILILGLLIGSGLWLIGVPYPFFWGFLAGFLEIIPYIGTSIGGVLPVVYVLMITDNFWQPFAVIVLYLVVQQLEGNLISPNVMGASVRINPLFVILGLFVGGVLWGIAGMVLALPILAMSKEIFRTYDMFKPLSYLMEDGLLRKKDIFLERFDDEKYRFFNLFFNERKD